MAWIQTYRGKNVDPLDPKPEDFDIVDIAHALSNLCRFTGHCYSFYSVAEHSVRVAQLLPHKMKLYGLLHDATEAYIADVSRPLKQLPEWATYRQIENQLECAIFKRFGLKHPMPELIKQADNALLVAEAKSLMFGAPGWNLQEFDTGGLEYVAEPDMFGWNPPTARAMFLNLASVLLS